jgi:hypothetical protein
MTAQNLWRCTQCIPALQADGFVSMAATGGQLGFY